MMITLIAESKYGFSGQYVARITGRDGKFTFRREFTGRKEGKRGETTRAEVDEPGLYEVCDVDKRGKDSSFFVVAEAAIKFTKPGEDEKLGKLVLVKRPMDKAEAMKLAKALDTGRTFADMVRMENTGLGSDGATRLWDYTVLSEHQEKKAQAAVTLESAQQACWQVLQALPEKEAKKVLTALRALVSPKPAAETAAPEDTELAAAPDVAPEATPDA